MKEFVALYNSLDSTTKISKRKQALHHFFTTASAADAAWVLYFLMGKKLSRLISTKLLRHTILELTELPEWLLDVCYERVGDLSETLALLAGPATVSTSPNLSELIEGRLLPLRSATDSEKVNLLCQLYQQLSQTEIFLVNKLMTGGFRVGVASGTIIQVLAEFSGNEPQVIAARLLGDWQPSAENFIALCQPASSDEQQQLALQPFMLAAPLTEKVEHLGEVSDWLVEWKYDGIRAQLIKDEQTIQLWSRGEELINEQFPEIIKAAESLSGNMIIDGEIIAYKETILPFHALQKRINRKRVSKTLLAEMPCVFQAFDCLHAHGQALQTTPLEQRRTALEAVISNTGTIRYGPLLNTTSWSELALKQQQSRQHQVEGLMLKARTSPYVMGRKRGHWWKWKIDAMTIDAVLVQAQRPFLGIRTSRYLARR